MKKILVEFKVLDTSGSINKTSEQMGNLGRQTQKTTKKFKDNTANAGLNNAILMETSRLASDASFGFMAIGNNLSQLINLFQMSAKSAGGVTAAFRKLLTLNSLLIVGIQLVISFLPKMIKKFQESRKEADSLSRALGQAEASTRDFQSQVSALMSAIDSGTLSFVQSEEALKKLKKITGLNNLELDASNKLTKESIELIGKQIKIRILETKIQAILERIKAREKKFFEEIAEIREKENSKIFKFFTLLQSVFQPVIDFFNRFIERYNHIITAIADNPIARALGLGALGGLIIEVNEKLDSQEQKLLQRKKIQEELSKVEKERNKDMAESESILDDLTTQIFKLSTAEGGLIEKRYEFLEITEKQIAAIQREREAFLELNRLKLRFEEDLIKFQGQSATFAIERVMAEDKLMTERIQRENIGAVNSLKAQEATAAKDLLIAEKTNEAKKVMLFDLGDAIVQAAGEGSAVGKAAAVAMAIMNVHEGITKALTLKPPFSFIAAATVALKGFSAVRSIMSTKIPGGGGGGGASAPSGIGGASDVAAPDFNVVGDTGTSTLARVLGEGRRTPTRAYVSMNDVIENNEIMRNIEDTVSL